MRKIVLKSTEVPTVQDAPHAWLQWQAERNGTSRYDMRTDRNIGWITAEDQHLLQRARVGVAGCGGMGGLIATIFARLGVGCIRIADIESFERSNLNRQIAATEETVGKNKCVETARLLRSIASDVDIELFPMGISTESVGMFTRDCSIVFDEIEFWSIGSRLLLHAHAHKYNVPLVMCSSVGFSTRLMCWNGSSLPLRDLVSMTVSEACEVEERIRTDQVTLAEQRDIGTRLIRGLLPGVDTTHPAFERLLSTGTAPIIATNPPLAAGFAANWGLTVLLRALGSETLPVSIHYAPKYLAFDSLSMRAWIGDHEYA